MKIEFENFNDVSESEALNIVSLIQLLLQCGSLEARLLSLIITFTMQLLSLTIPLHILSKPDLNHGAQGSRHST